MDDANVGLYPKYVVQHADGRGLDGDCFVLRPDRDLAAWHALFTYATFTDNERLADDIYAWLERARPLVEAAG